MASALHCPRCLDKAKFCIDQRQQNIEIKGERFVFKDWVQICFICKHQVINPVYDKAVMRMAYDMWREKHNIPSPEKVKKIREKYGLTQKEFCKLLGFSSAVLSRYEKDGNLMAPCYMELIRLMDNPKNMREVAMRNCHSLTKATQHRLFSNLLECLK